MRKELRLEKLFPDYFSRFTLPISSGETIIVTAYRACRTGRCDKDSFLPTFEENGYVCDSDEKDEPSTYSLSLFERPKDVKRFASMNSDMKVPYKIAIGSTLPEFGVAQRTKERTKAKTSHIDWWLYNDSNPSIVFTLIPNFENFYDSYKQGGC